MPDPFSTTDLTRMRATQTAHQPDTCTILSLTETIQSSGHILSTWGTLSADVACRFVPMSLDTERLAADMMEAAQTYVVTMAYDGTIEPAYVVVYSGGTYEVTAVQEQGSWKTAKRVLVVAVTP